LRGYAAAGAEEQFMSVELSQEPRLLAISTSTDKTFVLRRFEAVEAISRLFLVQAEVLSLDHGVKAADVIGHTATVSVARGLGEQPRYFNGVISAFRRIGRFGTRWSAYGIEIVPSFWHLTRKSNCRVFQNQSVPAIVKKLASEGGAGVPSFMSAPDTPRKYCMQYNETDFDFCQRLMDETGCGYYFLHGENDHTMLVASSAADFQPISAGPYKVMSGSSHWDALTGFSLRTGQQPGAVRTVDYDQIKPSNLPDSTTTTILTEVQNDASYEMFVWPGGQHTKPDADPSLYIMQTFEAEADIARATGHDPALVAGCKIDVQLDPNDPATKTFILTRVVHSGFDETHITDGAGAGYSCAITMMPDDRPFRPPAPRPRPVVPGLQSAVVVGPRGEEILTDKYGRVKIRFLWDRHWPKDETACEIWVRVAQPYAGKWGGAFFLPRIGDEVLVGFVDGDPDKPIIVGSLYSDDAPPPGSFPMPSKKERSGFHTRSSKGGGANNANILYFDDKKGSEEVYLQAEKNMNVLVKNARTETINVGNFDGDDTYLLRKGDKIVTVGTAEDGGDFFTYVTKGDYVRMVQEGDDFVDIAKGNRQIVVGEGDHSTLVSKGDHVLVVNQGDNNVLVEQGDHILQVDQGDSTQTVSLGNITINAGAGKIEMSAGQSIELKVGASSVKIDHSGVTIKGMSVKIDASLSFEAKAGLSAKVGGTFTNVEGNAITTIKGGFVLIN
jgi:type VI secretion system secreted protein VgrG